MVARAPFVGRENPNATRAGLTEQEWRGRRDRYRASVERMGPDGFAQRHERHFYENTQPLRDVVRRRLRNIREVRQLTQEQLAHAMRAVGFPMDKPMISEIENGKRRVQIDELLAFGFVLEVPVVRLITDRDGEPAIRLGDIGLERHEVANLLVLGPPANEGTKRAQERMRLLRQIPTVRQVLEDERDANKKARHTKTIGALINDLWRASGIRPGVMNRQELRDPKRAAE